MAAMLGYEKMASPTLRAAGSPSKAAATSEARSFLIRGTEAMNSREMLRERSSFSTHACQ